MTLDDLKWVKIYFPEADKPEKTVLSIAQQFELTDRSLDKFIFQLNWYLTRIFRPFDSSTITLTHSILLDSIFCNALNIVNEMRAPRNV